LLKRYKILAVLLSLFLLGYLIPDRRAIPVAGATSADWNPNTFWYEPWGASGVHKGVDIFAEKGRPVIASSDLLLLYRGEVDRGGNIVLGLGPKWRLHYFAHLQDIDETAGLLVSKGQRIGSVGDSGNAKGKAPHLHFSLLSVIPLPWRIDGSTQGYKKAFYLNPIEYFSDN
jgi:murein DD-endopeptidase MepM/ murein hydrolase activator NlpD